MPKLPVADLTPVRSRNPQAEARRAVLDAANAHRQRVDPNAHPWGRRHIQQAVFVVRQSRLVAPKVLTAAGYRPTGR